MLRAVLRTIPLVVLLCPRDAVAGPPPPADIVVRVYDTAGVDRSLLTSALDTATAALASASIRVSWKHCQAAPTAPCDRPASSALILRLVRLDPDRLDGDMTLGDAFIDAGAGSAVLATIYVDRVARFAHDSGVQDAPLLGYAVAHELGHLLLATRVHGASGLMRAVWADAELRHPRESDWMFSAEEMAAIHDRLAALHAAANIVWTTR